VNVHLKPQLGVDPSALSVLRLQAWISDLSPKVTCQGPRDAEPYMVMNLLLLN